VATTDWARQLKGLAQAGDPFAIADLVGTRVASAQDHHLRAAQIGADDLQARPHAGVRASGGPNSPIRAGQ
jgi:hypothetical protein